MSQPNETYINTGPEGFLDGCAGLFAKKSFLRMMFATDERASGGCFRIYAVFSPPESGNFEILVQDVSDVKSPSFASITRKVPAAHWYEREIRDMFGITPEGHPDPRPLVLHGMYPEGVWPLRRDVSADDVRRVVDISREDNYQYMSVKGEGVYEIPVGPVHAGIIEPGHFRFSAVGETIYHLDPRLFYTHKGIEKQFERIGFIGGVELAERVSGVSSFSHSAAYCHAVERMAGIELPEKAAAARTALIELERLYNHIGDIGNMCAGTGFAVGYARGASIKETLMRLNQRLTGSRYLRGVNVVGGIKTDVLEHSDDILTTLDLVKREYKSFLALLLSSISHVERMEDAGILSRSVAHSMGATGPAARASGVGDDVRHAHPHLFYDRVIFETHTRTKGDVFARMMVRADEVGCSLSIIEALLEKPYKGKLAVPVGSVPPLSSALGYVEGPRGSIFYWVKSDKDGKPLRVKARSASHCNWPVVPFAVNGNIVPDFPLINKSFNLSYSGCDL